MLRRLGATKVVTSTRELARGSAEHDRGPNNRLWRIHITPPETPSQQCRLLKACFRTREKREPRIPSTTDAIHIALVHARAPHRASYGRLTHAGL